MYFSQDFVLPAFRGTDVFYRLVQAGRTIGMANGQSTSKDHVTPFTAASNASAFATLYYHDPTSLSK